MPRQWRCARGHAWTGELGGLTYCPECNSADVYEVRGEAEPGERNPAAPPASSRSPALKSDSTADLPIFQEPPPAAAGDTAEQPVLASPTASASSVLERTPDKTAILLAEDLGQSPGEKSPPPRDASPLPGYEILGMQGRGGVALVYKARELERNRLVAIKMIVTPAQAPRAETLTRVRGLHHPHLVEILASGEREGVPYLVTEFAEGGTLQTRLNGMPQDPRAAARLVAALCEVVQYLHAQGMVHGAISSRNVLLFPAEGGKAERSGRSSAADAWSAWVPKLSDLGLRRPRGTGSARSQARAAGYWPAEQTADTAATAAGDLFALGAVLYEMLVGRPPFLGVDAAETTRCVRAMTPVPPSALVPSVPPELEAIVLRCLAREPATRIPSAQALHHELTRFLAGQTRPMAPEKTVPAARENRPALPTPSRGALLLVIGLAFLAILGWQQAWREHRRAEALSSRAPIQAAPVPNGTTAPEK